MENWQLHFLKLIAIVNKAKKKETQRRTNEAEVIITFPTT